VSIHTLRPAVRAAIAGAAQEGGFDVVLGGDDADVRIIDLETAAPAPAGVPVVYVAGSGETALPLPVSGSAILPLHAPDEALIAAVEAVASGLAVIAPEFLAAYGLEPRTPAAAAPPTPEALTPREIEVVRLLALGLPNKAIAPRLGISENTVKYHVAAILAKLSAQSRAEAVMLAARMGVIPL
jgi:DNA-binding NarL/FixJ family response regulator